MANATDTKYGEIKAVDRFGRQRVETDDGNIYWFTGVDRVKGGRVGDRVRLDYRISPGVWGLWFASKIDDPSVDTFEDDDLFRCGCGEPTKRGGVCMQCAAAGSES